MRIKENNGKLEIKPSAALSEFLLNINPSFNTSLYKKAEEHKKFIVAIIEDSVEIAEDYTTFLDEILFIDSIVIFNSPDEYINYLFTGGVVPNFIVSDKWTDSQLSVDSLLFRNELPFYDMVVVSGVMGIDSVDIDFYKEKKVPFLAKTEEVLISKIVLFVFNAYLRQRAGKLPLEIKTDTFEMIKEGYSEIGKSGVQSFNRSIVSSTINSIVLMKLSKVVISD